MDRKAAWFIGLIVLSVALALLGSFGALTAQSPTETPIARYMMDVYADGRVVLSTLTPPPFPTWTPAQTETATYGPTPTATATLPPVPSSTPTAPPTTEPPPTMETTLQPPPPTLTSTPSMTPTPSDVKCWGYVTAPALNVRAEPWGDVLGQVHKDDYLTFDAQWYLDFWWWRIAWSSERIAWVSSNYIQVGDTADCSELEDVTPATILQGGHIIAANGANTLLDHCQHQTTVKLFEPVIHYADDFRACNPDIWIVCRFWTDKIASAVNYDALVAYDRVGDAFPPDCDAVEWENESAPTTERDWKRWSQFSIDAATLMADRRNMQYLAFSFGPGWPAYPELQHIVDYLRWVADNPLADGRYHGVASHAAMFAPWSRSDMPWVNNDHIAGRVYFMRDWMTVWYDFDLETWPGVWSITEIGLSDGYSGNWSAAYSCDQLKSAYWETHNTYREHSYPAAFQQWNYGAAGIWTDDSLCAGLVWG